MPRCDEEYLEEAVVWLVHHDRSSSNKLQAPH